MVDLNTRLLGDLLMPSIDQPGFLLFALPPGVASSAAIKGSLPNTLVVQNEQSRYFARKTSRLPSFPDALSGDSVI